MSSVVQRWWCGSTISRGALSGIAGSYVGVRGKSLPVDWSGWAIYGLIATAALTAVMAGAQLMGWTRVDLPLMLGTMVVPDPDRARVAGFFLHLGAGQLFALGYAWAFAVAGEATWWAGGLLGLLHG